MLDKTITKRFMCKVYWPRVYPAFKDDGKYGPQYTVDVEFVNDEDYKELRKLGFQARKNENTGYVKLRRKEQAVREEWGGPPAVFLKTDKGTVSFEQPIGNGSVAEIVIDLFPYKSHGGGVGHRLQSLTVHDLIEYDMGASNGDTPDDDFTPGDPTTIRAEGTKEGDFDDDIPFGS